MVQVIIPKKSVLFNIAIQKYYLAEFNIHKKTSFILDHYPGEASCLEI